jgi:hypothetical protein
MTATLLSCSAQRRAYRPQDPVAVHDRLIEDISRVSPVPVNSLPTFVWTMTACPSRVVSMPLALLPPP